jgi:hypothetical protein
MTVTICQGCGRRASSEEIHCAACGRPLVEGDEAPPAGWLTAETGYEPVVRPEATAAPAADLSVEEEVALFVPAGARRADTDPSAAQSGSELALEPAEDPAGTATEVSLPGGHGWRVRVTAANAARAQMAGASGEPDAEARGRRRRLPRWIFPVLVVAILFTSGAAALLIVIHVLHS